MGSAPSAMIAKGERRPTLPPELLVQEALAAANAPVELVKHYFDRLDVNKDGNLDVNELGTVLKRLDPMAWTDEKVNALLSLVDRNHNGTIQLHEFADWLFSPECGQVQQQLLQVLE